MSDLKYEWPYIQYLSKDDRENYVSDLPLEMDTFQVRRLEPSYMWQENQRMYVGDPVYITPERAREYYGSFYRAGAWSMLYFLVIYKGYASICSWYSANVVKNYLYFKAESWPRYLKRGFWPAAAVGWTAFHIMNRVPFCKYPFPQSVVEWMVGDKE